jgi:hypothetical protein
MNDELERIGEWLCPEILSWQFLGGTEKDHDKPVLCPIQDLS